MPKHLTMRKVGTFNLWDEIRAVIKTKIAADDYTAFFDDTKSMGYSRTPYEYHEPWTQWIIVPTGTQFEAFNTTFKTVIEDARKELGYSNPIRCLVLFPRKTYDSFSSV